MGPIDALIRQAESTGMVSVNRLAWTGFASCKTLEFVAIEGGSETATVIASVKPHPSGAVSVRSNVGRLISSGHNAGPGVDTLLTVFRAIDDSFDPAELSKRSSHHASPWTVARAVLRWALYLGYQGELNRINSYMLQVSTAGPSHTVDEDDAAGASGAAAGAAPRCRSQGERIGCYTGEASVRTANNDGRQFCLWCAGPTKRVELFTGAADVCRKCGR